MIVWLVRLGRCGLAEPRSQRCRPAGRQRQQSELAGNVRRGLGFEDRVGSDKLRPTAIPLEMFLDGDTMKKLTRVPGTAVFMSGNPEGTPIALLHNLKHNKILHQRNLLLTLVTEDVPQVNPANRFQVEKLGSGFQRIIARYGFMEEPNVPELLAAAPLYGEPINLHRTTFFLSRETIVPTRSKTMHRWRQWVFAALSRNAQSAASFYRIPANRVIELGMQVEL